MLEVVAKTQHFKNSHTPLFSNPFHLKTRILISYSVPQMPTKAAWRLSSGCLSQNTWLHQEPQLTTPAQGRAEVYQAGLFPGGPAPFDFHIHCLHHSVMRVLSWGLKLPSSAVCTACLSETIPGPTSSSLYLPEL